VCKLVENKIDSYSIVKDERGFKLKYSTTSFR